MLYNPCKNLLAIAPRSRLDRCQNRVAFLAGFRGAIAALFAERWERSRRDRCHQSLSVFGRISRRDESDRSAIAVVDRLAFLAGFRGAMRAIAERSLSSIA